jgi:tetratricopeptide (TPR) repeat protein/transcriptional regulator with XRE-family HTH domain
VIPDSDQASADFGRLLRRLRIDAGLSQEELAEAATVSARSVSDLERGISRTARPHTARLLAAALGLAGPEQAGFLATARGQAHHEAGSHAATKTGGSAWPVRESAPGEHRALPRDISAFTGRADELERTVRAVTDLSVRNHVIRICAIGGMAGIGKTTLAVHAAHLLAPQFPDGQIFVPLHGHTPGQRAVDPSDALATLLLAAGFDARQIPADLDARERCWREYLAPRKVLLVLDDATGHDQIRPLLPGTGGNAALVTSRQRLSALEDAAVIDLDTLPRRDAVSLLVRLSGRDELTAGDPAVADLASQCGDLPLAIGMAARQLHHHPARTPADLITDLTSARNRLDLMRTENVSVAAAFDLSYRTLTTGQRRLFRRLGLHFGPDIDVYAAAALANVSLATARRQLDALYDQHLLTEPAAGRYRFHDLLREHARTLAASGNPDDREAAINRDLDYFTHTAATAAEQTPRWPYSAAPPAPGQPPACRPPIASASQAVSWMETERANLYAAASYAAATSRYPYTIALSAAMTGFLEARGPWDKAIALQQDAITTAAETHDKPGQARNLLALAGMQEITGDSPKAAATCAQALEIYRDLGDVSGQADTFNGLAALHTGTGDYQLAAEYAERALALYTRIPQLRWQCDALFVLAAVHEAAGDYPAAVACCRRAEQLATEQGDRWGQLNATRDLGIMERLTGDYANAERHQRQALELAREYQDRGQLAAVLFELGVLQRLTGDYEAAAASHRSALEQYRELGQIDGIAVVSNDLGLLQQVTGDYQAAAASHLEALAIYTEYGRRPGQAEVLNSLGEMYAKTGDSARAREHHATALRIARDLPARPEEARALEGIGRSNLGFDNREAEKNLRQALDIYRRLGTPDALRIRVALRELGLTETLDPS